jgi:hypothetical protein
MKKFIERAKDIPKEPHYALIDNRSVFIPGDERSKSCPGHGYPDSTEHFISYTAYTNRDDLIKELSSVYYRKKDDITVIYVTPVHINTTVSIELNEIK